MLPSIVPFTCRVPGLARPWFRRVLVALAASWLSGALLGDGPDDRFIDVYNVIQQADQAPDKRVARQLYEQAQERLQALRRDYPTWNERVVSYRLRYTADKLSTLPQAGAQAPDPGKADAPPPIAVAASGEVISQFNEFTQQIRLLQSDKQLLEAKLREALTAQPAPVDPREFQAAIERIATLQQTNKTLISTLQQQQAERANLVDKVVLEETQRALSEANRTLTGQRNKADQLERERAVAAAELKRLQEESVKPLNLENSILKQQVKELKSDTEKGRQVANLTAQLTRLEAGLNDLKQQNAALLADKASLEKQVEDFKARSAEEGIVRIAQLESQLAVAAAESARQSARVEDISARLAQERVAKTTLQTENQELSKRVADLTASSADDAEVKKQLQEALAAEKAERVQAEADLRLAEQKMLALRDAALTAPRSVGTSPAAANGAALLLENQMKGLQTEIQNLRENLKGSTQRESELTTALAQESSLRQRLQKEKSDLEKRLAAANVELAANRVENARATLPPSNPSIRGPRSAGELEARVQLLEQERSELRGRLAQLTQQAPLNLAAARNRRAVSPRDRPSEFLQFRQLKAFAAEPITPVPDAQSPSTVQNFAR